MHRTCGAARSDLAVQTLLRDCLLTTVLAALAAASVCAPAVSQSVYPTGPAASNAALPEPVYWSQQLFLIPYKWDSGSTATGASAVKLYLSRDRGQTWSEISDAKPEVQFFNYHAPGDGEYWFSMRTIDSVGRAWPEGPHQAELRVIVDTQNPTVTSFNAQLRADGTAVAAWQASDPNVNTGGSKLQYRTPTDTDWRDVPSGSLRTPAVGFVEGGATWKVPAGTPSIWVRLAVRDLAGNGREAGAEARMQAAPSAQLASSSYRLPPVPQVSTRAGTGGVGTAAGLSNSAKSQPVSSYPTALPSAGWTSGSALAANPHATTTADPASSAYARPAPQAWPSDGQALVPLGSSGASATASNRLNSPPLSTIAPAPTASQGFASPFQMPSSTSQLPTLHTASARPFGPSGASAGPSNSAPALNNLPSLRPVTTQRPALGVRHLNSLEFEIGYDVDTAGTYGVTRVELWGTSDSGRSWRRLAVDTDNRSPILATVPAPGDYGLKIVVETAGGIDPVRPRPGDQPEMHVRIDTTAPVAKLTGIAQGAGSSADHLMVKWRPSDSLSREETVSLSYSSHSNGPWVTAVANLPNNGHYAWRLARHLPRSFYVRLEVRDQAGNVSTDQTRVPVQITLPTPSGRLGEVRAVQ